MYIFDMYACVYACTHTYVYMRARVYVYTYVRARAHTHTHTCTQVLSPQLSSSQHEAFIGFSFYGDGFGKPDLNSTPFRTCTDHMWQAYTHTHTHTHTHKHTHTHTQTNTHPYTHPHS